jgi:7-keto-8-aminopelargonate synthetase-like enzyme
VNELDVVSVNGKELTLVDGRKLTEFVSCSYLGLDQRAELREAAHAVIDRFGVQMSAARTRVRPSIFHELEALLGTVCGGRTVVTFNSVSATHLGVLPLLASGELPGHPIASSGPAFIVDRSAHASLQALRGVLAPFGPVERLDFDNLEGVRSAARDAAGSGRTAMLICDSVGSMGGTADLHALVELAEEVAGCAYFDDAHGTSAFGSLGEGSVLRVPEMVHHGRVIVVGSLSKAFGATGGFVAFADRRAASLVKRYAVPYAFGGPPSLPAIGAAVASARLHLDGTVAALQQVLRQRTRRFDELLARRSINAGTSSPIRCITIGDEFAAVEAAEALQEHGFAATAATYPTVAMGGAVLRLGFSASHTESEVRGIAETINAVLEDERGSHQDVEAIGG